MPANVYKLADGARVPGVTTILSRFKDGGGLIHWAWKEGREGRDYRETRDAAGDIGTMVHDAIEAWLRGEEPVLLDEQAENAFGAFRQWWDAESVVPQHIEVRLVSEEYQYGGQWDLHGTCATHGVTLFDWKSSKRVYPDHLAQLGAYRQLAREHGMDDPKAGCVLRLDKATGKPDPVWFTEADLDAGWDYFRRARELYEADRVLRKAVA